MTINKFVLSDVGDRSELNNLCLCKCIWSMFACMRVGACTCEVCMLGHVKGRGQPQIVFLRSCPCFLRNN